MKLISLVLVCLMSNVTLGAGFKNQYGHQEYLWDFAVSGGSSAAAIDLSAISGKANLPSGAIVTNVSWSVLTALTSSANASVTVGNSATADCYVPATLYSAFGGSDQVSGAQLVAASCLWDNTNDVAKLYKADSATKLDFKIAFNTDVTAGKILFWVDYYVPSL